MMNKSNQKCPKRTKLKLKKPLIPQSHGYKIIKTPKPKNTQPNKRNWKQFSIQLCKNSINKADKCQEDKCQAELSSQEVSLPEQEAIWEDLDPEEAISQQLTKLID